MRVFGELLDNPNKHTRYGEWHARDHRKLEAYNNLYKKLSLSPGM